MTRALTLTALLLVACSDYDLTAGEDVSGRGGDDVDVDPNDPQLEITPNPLDFGGVGVNCESTATVTLSSVGGKPLEITEIGGAGGEFEILSAPDLPLGLQPGESAEVEILFQPSSDSEFSDALEVTSDDPRGVREGDLLGEGANDAGEEYIETWEMLDDPPTDIMFSLDSSCSMTSDIWSMYNNFDAFVELLESLTGDWQIVVVNNSDGCNNSGILRPSTVNYSDAFKSALFGWNWDTDYTEALLTINESAVQQTDAGECNSGFIREDAMLHIIDISDEPEQSFEQTGRDWEELVDSIIDKKGDPALTTISAIAGDVPDGCDDADAGTGYWEAVEKTNGVFLSVCQEWHTTNNLQLLAEASINQDTFQLSRETTEDSIVVTINGEETTDWSWDEDSNSVVLDDPAGGGDVVEIAYEALGGCE